MPLLRERLEQPNKQPNSFPASTGQDSCRRAVRIVDIDHVDEQKLFDRLNVVYKLYGDNRKYYSALDHMIRNA